jgi:hypothetical protein
MNEMTCRDFDEIVHAYVRMELLDVRLRDAVLEHTAVCANCAERLTEAIALADATDAESRRVQVLQTPAHVEAALLTEFRSHQRRASWRRTFEWASVGAAAAVILIIFWTAGIRSKRPSQSLPGKDVSSHSTAPVDAKSLVAMPVDAAQGVEEAALSPASEAATGARYVVSDFVPVPFTGAIAADDAGMVVRVQLTRASLAQLGYPVEQAPEGDLIRADVLVGEDGWPRGVKLVE